MPCRSFGARTPVQDAVGYLLGAIGSTIVFGMVSVAGGAAAYALIGPRTIRHEAAVSEATAGPMGNTTSGVDSCNIRSRLKAFKDCTKDNSKCQFYLDMLTECRRRSARQAPPPTPVQNAVGHLLRAIGSTIVQGMASVAGGAVMGPRTIQHEAAISEATAGPMGNTTSGMDSCNIHSKDFQDCTKDYSKCQFYLDMLTECRRRSGAAAAL